MREFGLLLVLVGLSVAGLPAPAAGEGSVVRIGRDVVVAEGTRVGEAVAVGGNVTVNGVVERSAVAVAGAVILGPRAVVGGDVVAVGGGITRAAGAEIRGDIVEVRLPGLSWIFEWHAWLWVFRITTFVGLLALALLIVAIVPQPVAVVSATVQSHALRVFAWGVLGLLATVPVAILLGISIVGIPLIPLEVLLVGCAFLFGYIAVAQSVGVRLTAAVGRPEVNVLWQTSWGLLTLSVVGWVLVLGWLVKAVAFLLGFGALLEALVSRAMRYRESRAGGAGAPVRPPDAP